MSGKLAGPASPRTIDLPDRVGRCTHGHELRDLYVEETADGWTLWGLYPCAECSQIALDLFRERPRQARIDGRRLFIRVRKK